MPTIKLTKLKNMTKYFKITGTGQTKFGELYNSMLEDLIFEATNQAMEAAGKSIQQVEAVIIGNMMSGEVSQQSQIGSVFAGMFNYNGPVFRTEAACASGGVAIYTALQGLLAGSYKNVLVIGAEKMTDFGADKIGEILMQAASSEEREAGLTFPALYSLMTEAYQAKYGLSREELSLAPYLMHKNALNNDKAQFRKDFSLEQIATSPLVAGQLRLLDCSPISDGAAAVFIETVDSPKDGIYLLASEIATDCPGLAERENQYSLQSTHLAMQKIKKKAEFRNEDLIALELHDCFSIALLMALEDMQICQPGKAAEFLKLVNEGTEKMLINPSGGLKACGHPVGATGIKQIVELCKVLKSNPSKFGLAQNVGGTGGTAVISLLASFN